ncbi:glycoside hydrolase family 3 N-terminal domain-containing protein [Prochlorococcus marinus]|uniref:glycoside hydrolase family 3 N-terminal domain-containing protein n=1 Tax=Prochlorococcus marinus TaxID=1219 RepID=UPI0022B5AAB5|nr:glycoside hydrolase family 3 N-terminal domain-containing protein [Prochlorococcus marinus]
MAELLVVRASGYAYDSQRKYPQFELSNQSLKQLLGEGVGGVILYGGSVNELKERTNILRSWSKYPILLCADVEEGVGQRFEGGSWLPPPMSLGLRYSQKPKESLVLAEEYGKCIGNQARRCGLNWVLAPVCDVNSNPLNPVINMRAWGSEPEAVAALTSAFHKGLVGEGVLSCAKHFPGHGETRVDSHMDLPIIENDISRLNDLELIPFQALINHGVNSVMTAHILFKNIDSSYPATFSKKFLLNLLRKKMGFDGIIVTDALVMKAITKRYGCAEAAVMAFEAGADLILMPEDPMIAINAIVDSLISGRISINRLETSLYRRRREISKLQKTLSKLICRQSSFQSKEFEDTNHLDLADKMIDMSIEIKHYSYIDSSHNQINLVRVDSLSSTPILTISSPALIIPKRLGCKNIIYHPDGVNPWQAKPQEPLAIERLGRGRILLQFFVRGNPFIGNQEDLSLWIAAVKQLQKNHLLSGLVVYGSFYFWKELLEILDSSVPAAYTSGQMPKAQEKLLQSFLQTKKEIVNTNNTFIDFTN